MPSLVNVLEPVTKAVALVGTASLLLSFAYDWAYLQVAHTAYAELPTTVADHAKSALNWLPSAVIGVTGISVARLLLSEVAFTAVGIIGFIGSLALSKAVGGSLPFTNSPLSWPLSTWLQVFLVAWTPLVLVGILRALKRRQAIELWAGMTLLIAPVALGMAAMVGAVHAEALTRGPAGRQSHQVLERGEGKPPLRVTVLRGFEKVVLAWDPVVQAPMLVPWTEIKAVLYQNTPAVPVSSAPPPITTPAPVPVPTGQGTQS